MNRSSGRWAALASLLVMLAAPAYAEDPAKEREGVRDAVRAKARARRRPEVPQADLTFRGAGVMAAEGIVHRVSDGEVMLAVPLDATRATALAGAGFRRIARPEDIADRTILNDHVYLAYLVAPGCPDAEALATWAGSKVRLELKRTDQGKALIVAAKKR